MAHFKISSPLLDSLKKSWPMMGDYLQLYGLAVGKIPMILWLTPRIDMLQKDRAQIRIPLNYRSKNHLGSLYFGALCVGADLAAGLLAYKLIAAVRHQTGTSVSMVFKDFQSKFLRRPEADTAFLCKDGEVIQNCIMRCLQSGSREQCTTEVLAFTGDDIHLPCAHFTLTLSVKTQK